VGFEDTFIHNHNKPGPVTGLPVPADAEIAVEGIMPPGKVRSEGPFGEWRGFYSKPGGQEHRAGLQDLLPVLHVEIDGAAGAGLDALAAAGADRHVDEPAVGHGAQAGRAIDGLDGREPALVVVGAGLGTDGGAVATAGALVEVDVARLVADGGSEAAGLALQGQQLGVGQEGEVVVSLALEGGAQGGLVGQHEADATGVGGEGVVEKVHGAADGGSGVEEVDLEAEVSEVSGGGHTGDACTGDEDRVVRVSGS